MLILLSSEVALAVVYLQARGIVHGTVWLTVVVTVWSGVPYVMAMRKLGPAA